LESSEVKVDSGTVAAKRKMPVHGKQAQGLSHDLGEEHSGKDDIDAPFEGGGFDGLASPSLLSIPLLRLYGLLDCFPSSMTGKV
jgi:hypothetical protein